MSFLPIKSLLIPATKRYKLDRQAEAALICRTFRKMLIEHYPAMAQKWEVKKFEKDRRQESGVRSQKGTLTIQAKDPAAASELRLHTEALLDHCREYPDLKKVGEIRGVVLLT